MKTDSFRIILVINKQIPSNLIFEHAPGIQNSQIFTSYYGLSSKYTGSYVSQYET